MEKQCYEIANELDFMQDIKNEGRGISCVRTVIAYLDREDFKTACTVVSNEWDKISSYKDIANYIISVGMFTPIKI